MTISPYQLRIVINCDLKNVGPISHCEPLHCHSPGVATVARRLRIDVHNEDNNDNDNA